jgi:hypothetical protein
VCVCISVTEQNKTFVTPVDRDARAVPSDDRVQQKVVSIFVSGAVQVTKNNNRCFLPDRKYLPAVGLYGHVCPAHD